jgi:SAM-dependent methyltransferase
MLFEDTEIPAKKHRVYEYIARQFASPQGRGGVIVATAMRFINWLPNSGGIKLLDAKQTDDLLEIGFGPGFGLERLCNLASRGTVTGIDLSSTMMAMAHARNRMAVNDGRLSLRQGSFEKLPVNDASMDGILAVNVLYFVEPLKSALAEAWRVLRPGGSLVIYVTDKSVMSWLQFDGRDTRQTFDKRGLYRLLRTGPFGTGEIEIRSLWLPFRFRGILAKVTKSVSLSHLTLA